MEKPPIATIINFCSNEKRFLPFCIQEALHFSRQIIVVVSDHFFDGKEEDLSLLEEVFAAFPEVLFVQYPYAPEVISKRIFEAVKPAHFWHSLSRLIGYHFLQEEVEAVLFLDADEIADGIRFLQWLDCSNYSLHTSMKFSNYWYFREARYQAEVWEDSILLVQKKALDPSILLHEEEREAIYDALPHPKRRTVLGLDQSPMFHHYSWVRSEEEMLRKVRAWGHRKDRDWEALVKEEFLTPFRGQDFVHRYPFRTVSPKIPSEEPSFLPKGMARVERLSPKHLAAFVEESLPPWWRKLLLLDRR